MEVALTVERAFKDAMRNEQYEPWVRRVRAVRYGLPDGIGVRGWRVEAARSRHEGGLAASGPPMWKTSQPLAVTSPLGDQYPFALHSRSGTSPGCELQQHMVPANPSDFQFRRHPR